MNEYLSTYFAQISFVVMGVVAIIAWALWFCYKNYLDGERIVRFIERRDEGYIFRSTEAISEELGLLKRRVVKLCSKHQAIRRNQLDRETWRIREDD